MQGSEVLSCVDEPPSRCKEVVTKILGAIPMAAPHRNNLLANDDVMNDANSAYFCNTENGQFLVFRGKIGVDRSP
jgi:hypothetical protein